MTPSDLQTVVKGVQDRIWRLTVDSLDSASLVVEMKNITEECFEPEAGKTTDPRVSKILLSHLASCPVHPGFVELITALPGLE